jgi:ATP phosphoribosyltransferase
MKDLVRQAARSKLVLVPKGDDGRPCLKAFQDATGIAVPEFPGRKLKARAGGRTFIKVKGRDIPRFIAAGYGDVGLTGSDSCEDYAASDDRVNYQTVGSRMCRFVLMAPASRAATVRRQLQSGKRLRVATSFPDLVRVRALVLGLDIRPDDMPVCGSVEVMPGLLGVPLVADLVSSGSTAKENGLVEIRTLMDVYPAIIVRSDSVIKRPGLSPGAISGIDDVLERRRRQIPDGSVRSYTLSLMRDANEAGKKAGEEFGEFMMAVSGDADTVDCENEIADLTYAQLVAAYSRGKPAKLSNVLRILIERNGGSK